MARIILKKEQGPVEVKIGDQAVHVCRCGLSKNPQGLCDSSHKKTLDEDPTKTYIYDDKLNREEVCDDCGHDSKCKCDCHKK